MTIGTQVIVQAVASRAYDGNKRTWYSYPLPKPKAGIITGQSKRYDGIRHPGYGYGEDVEPPSFEIEKQHKVWLVRFGLTQKEVPVFPSDLQEATVMHWKLPYR